MTDDDYIKELKDVTVKYVKYLSIEDILNCQYSLLIHSLRAASENQGEFVENAFDAINHMLKLCTKYVDNYDELEKLAENMDESKD